MSKVTRYTPEVNRMIGVAMVADANGRYVQFSDFDQVTAERDAALARINELLEDFQEMSDQADRRGVQASEFQDRMGDLQAQNGKLQQRLTAADERADVLETALRTIMGSHRFNVAGMSVTEIHALCFDALASKAALKPAEGGGDED